MNNALEIIWVWLHCYIALENNDNKNERFGTSPKEIHCISETTMKYNLCMLHVHRFVVPASLLTS